jgi:pimeloyl-ACP methyl ester carboxylesterase
MNPKILFATTPALKVAYQQTGPESGDPVILLHGFPYDVREFDAVRDRLTGRRVIVPYLRGFGPTRYRSKEIMRTGQQAALGKDVVDLLDALAIPRATLVGYDWGGRAACVAAALWPERVRALVSVGGYTIQNIAKSAAAPESPEQEQQYWYQWYFQLECGRAGLEANRKKFCKLLWKLWSPTWAFDAKLFSETAKSFDNPDFVATAIHSYRHRYANAPGDTALEPLEAALAGKPEIKAPTIVLHGEVDTVNPPSTSEGRESQFADYFERRLLPNVGHCPPAEDPEAVVRAIGDVLRHSAQSSA